MQETTTAGGEEAAKSPEGSEGDAGGGADP